MDADEFDNINVPLYDSEIESFLNGNPMLNFDEENFVGFDTFDNVNFELDSFCNGVNLNGNCAFHNLNREFQIL